MDVDVKDMTVPTLTFGAETKEMPAVVEETAVAEAQEPAWDDSLLSDEERQMVDNFVGQIDLDNSNAILQYGVGTQKKMADFSETALKNVRTKDLGEVGDLLSGVVTELKSFDELYDAFKTYMKVSTSVSSLGLMEDDSEDAAVNITKIQQMYCRVKEKDTDNTYQYVPVYAFLGKISVSGTEDTNDSIFCLINAIDGTIINAGLGY